MTLEPVNRLTYMIAPTHHRHDDIAFQYLPPTGDDDHRWVILCDGLPCAPERDGLLTVFAEAGWHAVLPHYAGTWKSAGQFLAASPADDIAGLAVAARAGTLVPGRLPADRVCLLGTSFGGAVALSLADHPAVSRTVALSPVVSFRAIAPALATLPARLRDAYPDSYRFDDADWQRLVRDKLIDLGRVGSEAMTKTAILAGQDDEQIPVDSIVDYALAGHATFFLAFPGHGHLGFSKVTGKVLDCVLACLDSAETADEWTRQNAAALYGAETIELDLP